MTRGFPLAVAFLVAVSFTPLAFIIAVSSRVTSHPSATVDDVVTFLAGWLRYLMQGQYIAVGVATIALIEPVTRRFARA